MATLAAAAVVAPCAGVTAFGNGAGERGQAQRVDDRGGPSDGSRVGDLPQIWTRLWCPQW